MTILLIILAIVGAIVGFVGSVMLLVAAFRVSPLWGLAVLLIPGAFIVFAIKHWADAKTGFLLSIAGMLLLGLGFVGGLAGALFQMSTTDMDGMIVQGPTADEPFTGFGDVEDDSQAPSTPTPGEVFGTDVLIATPTVVPTPTRFPTQTPTLPPPVRRRAGDMLIIETKDVAKHLGAPAEIYMQDGSDFKAILEAVRGDAIYVKRQVGGGSVSFPLKIDRIKEIRIPEWAASADR